MINNRIIYNINNIEKIELESLIRERQRTIINYKRKIIRIYD